MVPESAENLSWAGRVGSDVIDTSVECFHWTCVPGDSRVVNETPPNAILLVAQLERGGLGCEESLEG